MSTGVKTGLKTNGGLGENNEKGESKADHRYHLRGGISKFLEKRKGQILKRKLACDLGPDFV